MKWQLLGLVLVAACGNVTPPPDAPPAVDLMRGCAVYARMDEASWPATGRVVLDACGSHAGSVTGTGATTVVDPTRGRVGSFSMDACVEIPNAPELHGTTGLTMSAWIRPTAFNGDYSSGVISKRVDKSKQSEYGLFVWTGSRVWLDLGETDRYSGTATISTNVWSQLTAVFDSARTGDDRVRLFINGVPDPLMHTTIGNLGAMLPAFDSPLHLGCVPAPSAVPPTQQTFQGQLDDVAIWNRALTDDEIAFLYTSTQPGAR